MQESPTRAILVAAKLDEAWDGTVGPAEVVTLTYVRIINRASRVRSCPFRTSGAVSGACFRCVHRRYGMSASLDPRWCLC